jgi:hypothetical protein
VVDLARPRAAVERLRDVVALPRDVVDLARPRAAVERLRDVVALPRDAVDRLRLDAERERDVVDFPREADALPRDELLLLDDLGLLRVCFDPLLTGGT